MKRRAFLRVFSLGSVLFTGFYSKKVLGFYNVLMLRKNVACVPTTTVNLTISADTLKYNIFTAAGSPGTCVTVNLTVNSGIYVWSDSTATAAIEFGALPAGSVVNLTNSGYIMGMGGAGGGLWNGIQLSTVGGPAIRMTCAATIDSQIGYILGGGGGGGGDTGVYSGGGGAGGGEGGAIIYSGGGGIYLFPAPGGAIGASGTAGGTGSTGSVTAGSGGGGGRVVPSTTTTGPTPTTVCLPGDGGSGGGAGAAYYDTSAKYAGTGVGGDGGQLGVAGGNGSSTTTGTDGAIGGSGGGGGGYGAKGGTGSFQGVSTAPQDPGAAGGNAVVLNGHSVTWTGGLGANKVYGAVS